MNVSEIIININKWEKNKIKRKRKEKNEGGSGDVLFTFLWVTTRYVNHYSPQTSHFILFYCTIEKHKLKNSFN